MSASSVRVRVLIADSNYMGSELMANALSRYRNDFEIVGIASSSGDALHKVQACKPQVALLSPGWGHGDHTGFRVMQKVRDSHPRTTLVMLLQSLDRDSVIDAFRAGARGVFSRSDSLQSLAKCIRCVHNGEIWASNAQIEFLLSALPQPRPSLTHTKGVSSLTPREREVSRLVEEGKKNREIAETIGVTEHTVSNYLYRIFEKLEVSSRVQLILCAQTPRNAAES
jgi:DNA-binding NarL/FixJ family response regulator